MFNIGLNHAVTLLAEKKAKGRAAAAPKTLKELGAAPTARPIKVLKGSYGPYVSDGETNATLPEGTEPDSVTLEQALALIAERAAKGGKKKKKAPRPQSAKAKAQGRKSQRRRERAPRRPRRKRKPPSRSQSKAKPPASKGQSARVAGE